VESEGYELHLLALDLHEEDNSVSGVEVILQPRQVFELLEALEKHASKIAKEKSCATCVNFNVTCRLDPNQKRQCLQSQKSLYVPAYPTA